MRHEIIETVNILEIASGGSGIGKLSDQRIVFIPGTIPGDRVTARITKSKKQFAEARLIEVLEPSPFRRTPQCRHHADCGGCKWQIITYEKQIAYKEELVRNALIHIGRFEGELPISPIIPCQQEFHYRNKMEFSFGHDRDGKLMLGLHCPGSWERVFDIKECLLSHDLANQLVELVRQESIKLNLPPYHNYFHHGTLRFLVVRTGIQTGEWLINLITTGDDAEKVEVLLQRISAWLPESAGLMHGVTRRKSAVATTDQFRIIKGSGRMRELLSDNTFYIGPNTFFQSNTRQAEILFQQAQKLAEISPHDRVLELYAGTGAISITMARNVRHITAIELVAESVEAAKLNQQTNQIVNCEFLCGDVSDLIPQFENDHFDLVVVDPPRPGISPKSVQILKKIRSSRILYISCNPDTLARDAAMLTADHLYQLHRIQPVDMFPQTPHIECIALFKLQP